MKNEKGQVVIIILGVMILFLIFIPALVYYVQQEAKWTEKQRMTNIAFHLAEAGLDRGYWKLVERSENWDTIINGGNILGYDGNTTYRDIPSTSTPLGEYKISITSYTANEVLIRAWGRDASNREVRCIEAIFTRTPKEASMHVGGELEYKPNLEVHWGPVVCYTEIDQSPSDYWPRKYSRGKIEGRECDPGLPNPDTDNLEYWAYDDSLGIPAEVDLSTSGTYALLAKSSVVPSVRKKTGVTAATSDPPGSGYFTESVRFRKPGADGGDYSFTSSTSVIFVNGSAILEAGTWLNVRALIVTGDVDFNAKSTNYTTVIPVGASEEYKHPNATATWATFPGEGQPYTVTGCGMVGFLYVGGNLKTGAGGAKMVGAINVKGETSINTFTVYYSTTIASQIRYSWVPIRRKSWKEVKLDWTGGL